MHSFFLEDHTFPRSRKNHIQSLPLSHQAPLSNLGKNQSQRRNLEREMIRPLTQKRIPRHLAIRKPDAESVNQLRRQRPQFEIGDVLADAIIRAGGKGLEGFPVLDQLRARGPAFREEAGRLCVDGFVCGKCNGQKSRRSPGVGVGESDIPWPMTYCGIWIVVSPGTNTSEIMTPSAGTLR